MNTHAGFRSGRGAGAEGEGPPTAGPPYSAGLGGGLLPRRLAQHTLGGVGAQTRTSAPARTVHHRRAGQSPPPVCCSFYRTDLWGPRPRHRGFEKTGTRMGRVVLGRARAERRCVVGTAARVVRCGGGV